jgi:hypothetical protein
VSSEPLRTWYAIEQADADPARRGAVLDAVLDALRAQAAVVELAGLGSGAKAGEVLPDDMVAAAERLRGRSKRRRAARVRVAARDEISWADVRTVAPWSTGVELLDLDGRLLGTSHAGDVIVQLTAAEAASVEERLGPDVLGEIPRPPGMWDSMLRGRRR